MQRVAPIVAQQKGSSSPIISASAAAPPLMKHLHHETKPLRASTAAVLSPSRLRRRCTRRLPGAVVDWPSPLHSPLPPKPRRRTVAFSRSIDREAPQETPSAEDPGRNEGDPPESIGGGPAKEKEAAPSRSRKGLPTDDESIKDLTGCGEINDPDRSLPPLCELFHALKIQSLSENEVEKVFRSMDHDGDGLLSMDEVELLIQQSLASDSESPEEVQERARGFMEAFDLDGDGVVSMEEFTEKLKDLSKAIDDRIWKLALCVGLAGFAVGVIQPLTPLLITSVGISLSQYGMITSFYGLTKTIANVPAALLQETLGRIPIMGCSLLLLGTGFVGCGFSTGFGTLLASRAAVGAGVSVWTIATTTYALDVSHPLNRGRSMAPISTAFSIGGIIGPLLGGFMVKTFGLEATFIATGAFFGAMFVALRLLLDETLPGAQQQGQKGQKSQKKRPGRANRRAKAHPTSWKAFKAVMSYPEIMASMALNAGNRLVMGTAKLTLLPLLLVQVAGMDAAAVGTVFSAMSFFQLLCAQPAAAFADYTGHQSVLPLAGIGQGVAVAMLALVGSTGPLTLALAISLWAVSHTFIGASNYAYVSSVAPPEMRSQAVAVMKFSGDVATIFGGLVGACLAQKAGVGTALVTIGAIQVLAALLLFLMSLRSDDELPEPGGGGGTLVPA